MFCKINVSDIKRTHIYYISDLDNQNIHPGVQTPESQMYIYVIKATYVLSKQCIRK